MNELERYGLFFLCAAIGWGLLALSTLHNHRGYEHEAHHGYHEG